MPAKKEEETFAINVNANFPPIHNYKNLENAVKVYACGRVQAGPNAITEFAISLKMRKRNLFTMHLNVGLWSIF